MHSKCGDSRTFIPKFTISRDIKPPKLFNMTVGHDSWFKKFHHKCQKRIAWLVDLILVFLKARGRGGGLCGWRSPHDFAVSGTSVAGNCTFLGRRAKMMICQPLGLYMDVRIYIRKCHHCHRRNNLMNFTVWIPSSQSKNQSVGMA